MKTLSVGIVAGVAVAACAAAIADIKMPRTKFTMEACLKRVLGTRDGDVVKLELKEEKRVPAYEFEILGKDGKTWELECDANTGKITAGEQIVADANHPLFKNKARISPEQATEIALQAHPGVVEEVEYEIESDGDASYEIDIRSQTQGEIKLEVDAATGKIVEDNQYEVYQIGKE